MTAWPQSTQRRELLGIALLVGVREQCSEVQGELVVRRGGRRQCRAAPVAVRCELDAVGGKTICHEEGAYANGRRVVVEYGNQESAHVFHLPSAHYSESHSAPGPGTMRSVDPSSTISLS